MSVYSFYNNIQFPAELFLASFLFLFTEQKRKKGILRLLLFITVYFGVWSVLDLIWAAKLLPSNIRIGIFIRYIFICVSLVLGFDFCFQANRERLLFSLIGGYTVQHAAYSGYKLIFVLTGLHRNTASNSLQLISQLMIKYLFYFGIYILLYQLLIKGINWENGVNRLWYIWFLAAGVLVNVLILDMNMDGFSKSQMVMIRIFSVFDCILVLTVFSKWRENSQLKKDILLIQQLSKLKEDHYESLKENIELTNLKCHDFKHQIYQLRHQTGSREEVLDEMEEAINRYGAYGKTGNEAFDIVITEKSLICQQEKISFTYMADPQKLERIEKQDIYVLFGNILDNAIEAAAKVELPEKKVISLSVHAIGNMLQIQETNYYGEKLVMENGIPRTTKDNHFDHGYGLKSIRYIADKYDGDLLIGTEDDIFELKILIPFA